MTACVIMHNMIVQTFRALVFYYHIVHEHGVAATFEQFTQFHEDMRDWGTHVQLQNDMVEYMWAHVGNQ